MEGSEQEEMDTEGGLVDQADFRRKLYAQLKSTGVVNAVKASPRVSLTGLGQHKQRPRE